MWTLPSGDGAEADGLCHSNPHPPSCRIHHSRRIHEQPPQPAAAATAAIASSSRHSQQQPPQPPAAAATAASSRAAGCGEYAENCEMRWYKDEAPGGECQFAWCNPNVNGAIRVRGGEIRVRLPECNPNVKQIRLRIQKIQGRLPDCNPNGIGANKVKNREIHNQKN